jgi:hypothetical protein
MKELFKQKKLVMIVITLLITQLACGLGGSQPEPGQGQLDTMVAETMNARHLQETATAVVRLTQSPATATLQASQTALADTTTPTVIQTATATLTPTISADDPKKSLGTPDWQEQFDNANSWTLFDSATSKTEVKNGRFLFTMYEALNSSEWTVTWQKATDYYLEVTATTPANCSGKDRYGLLFRAPDPSQGYVLMFSCDGNYRLSSWNGKDWVDLVKWTASDDITSGGDKSNRVGIWVKGQKFRIYANGKLQKEVMDDLFTEEGRFGLAIASANTNNFTVAFDDLLFWELE